MATHFYFNGHTYEIEPAAQSWSDARDNAAALSWDDDGAWGVSADAYLAVISSVEENGAILKHVKASVPNGQTTAADGGGADYLWIGASDQLLEGEWRWLDASLLSAGYQNWGSVEPDNYLADQNYLGFAREAWPVESGLLGNAGQWNDLDGDNMLWSIIEWDGIIGTEINERLNGTDGDDLMDGNAGHDVIRAGDGNDTIFAGDGDDKVYAGAGNNTVIAETGTIHSDDGNDKIWSKEGDDFIAAGVGDDLIRAGDGDNLVLGGEGDDKIYTGDGNDTINIDGYYADAGSAGAGDDIIKTGGGNDFIVMGKGTDIVWGGSGNDTFVFDNIDEGVDTIKDFHAGTDGGTVDILQLDATIFSSLEDGLLPTYFIKGGGLAGPSQNETGVDDYLIYDTRSGRLYYDADGHLDESSPVLLAIVKGKMADFGVEDISIV